MKRLGCPGARYEEDTLLLLKLALDMRQDILIHSDNEDVRPFTPFALVNCTECNTVCPRPQPSLHFDNPVVELRCAFLTSGKLYHLQHVFARVIVNVFLFVVILFIRVQNTEAVKDPLHSICAAQLTSLTA